MNPAKRPRVTTTPALDADYFCAMSSFTTPCAPTACNDPTLNGISSIPLSDLQCPSKPQFLPTYPFESDLAALSQSLAALDEGLGLNEASGKLEDAPLQSALAGVLTPVSSAASIESELEAMLVAIRKSKEHSQLYSAPEFKAPFSTNHDTESVSSCISRSNYDTPIRPLNEATSKEFAVERSSHLNRLPSITVMSPLLPATRRNRISKKRIKKGH